MMEDHHHQHPSPSSQPSSNDFVLDDEQTFIATTGATILDDSFSKYPLKNITHVHPHDVLCGRGGQSNSHPGNAQWRMLVAANKELYVTLPKKQKMLLSQSIVNAVRSQNPPGRFLQKDSDGNSLWYDVGDKRAQEKTSQALREGAPDIRTKLNTNVVVSANPGVAVCTTATATSTTESVATPLEETTSSVSDMAQSPGTPPPRLTKLREQESSVSLQSTETQPTTNRRKQPNPSPIVSVLSETQPPPQQPLGYSPAAEPQVIHYYGSTPTMAPPASSIPEPIPAQGPIPDRKSKTTKKQNHHEQQHQAQQTSDKYIHQSSAQTFEHTPPHFDSKTKTRPICSTADGEASNSDPNPMMMVQNTRFSNIDCEQEVHHQGISFSQEFPNKNYPRTMEPAFYHKTSNKGNNSSINHSNAAHTSKDSSCQCQQLTNDGTIVDSDAALMNASPPTLDPNEVFSFGSIGMLSDIEQARLMNGCSFGTVMSYGYTGNNAFSNESVNSNNEVNPTNRIVGRLNSSNTHFEATTFTTTSAVTQYSNLSDNADIDDTPLPVDGGLEPVGLSFGSMMSIGTAVMECARLEGGGLSFGSMMSYSVARGNSGIGVGYGGGRDYEIPTAVDGGLQDIGTSFGSMTLGGNGVGQQEPIIESTKDGFASDERKLYDNTNKIKNNSTDGDQYDVGAVLATPIFKQAKSSGNLLECSDTESGDEDVDSAAQLSSQKSVEWSKMQAALAAHTMRSTGSGSEQDSVGTVNKDSRSSSIPNGYSSNTSHPSFLGANDNPGPYYASQQSSQQPLYSSSFQHNPPSSGGVMNHKDHNTSCAAPIWRPDSLLNIPTTSFNRDFSQMSAISVNEGDFSDIEPIMYHDSTNNNNNGRAYDSYHHQQHIYNNDQPDHFYSQKFAQQSPQQQPQRQQGSTRPCYPQKQHEVFDPVYDPLPFQIQMKPNALVNNGYGSSSNDKGFGSGGMSKSSHYPLEQQQEHRYQQQLQVPPSGMMPPPSRRSGLDSTSTRNAEQLRQQHFYGDSDTASALPPQANHQRQMWDDCMNPRPPKNASQQYSLYHKT